MSLVNAKAVTVHALNLQSRVSVWHLLTLHLSEAFLENSVDPFPCSSASCNLEIIHMDCHEQIEYSVAIDLYVPKQEVVIEYTDCCIRFVLEKENECQLEHQWSVREAIHCPKANKDP